MGLSKEDLAKAEAALDAEELIIRKKRCLLKGHRWDLPSANPLNTDTFECALRCNRCNDTAVLTIVLDEPAKAFKAAQSK